MLPHTLTPSLRPLWIEIIHQAFQTQLPEGERELCSIILVSSTPGRVPGSLNGFIYFFFFAFVVFILIISYLTTHNRSYPPLLPLCASMVTCSAPQKHSSLAAPEMKTKFLRIGREDLTFAYPLQLILVSLLLSALHN